MSIVSPIAKASQTKNALAQTFRILTFLD